MSTYAVIAGHGGKDPGACSSGYEEKDWTLDIAKKVYELLKEQDFTAKNLRTKDVYISYDDRSDAVKATGYDFCLDIHINAGGGLGSEVIKSIHNKDKLADLILEELGKIGRNISRHKGKAFTKMNSRGTDWYHMQRETGSVKTLTVEFGFIDTAEDRNFLKVESNRQKCAEAVVKAICKHDEKSYKVKGVTKPETPSNASPAKANLRVDGYWGELTTRELQKHFGTPEDGEISKPSLLIKAIQRVVGARVDGYLGEETISKMQIHFGTPVDSVISEPSLMVKAMQRRLNEGKF